MSKNRTTQENTQTAPKCCEQTDRIYLSTGSLLPGRESARREPTASFPQPARRLDNPGTRTYQPISPPSLLPPPHTGAPPNVTLPSFRCPSPHGAQRRGLLPPRRRCGHLWLPLLRVRYAPAIHLLCIPSCLPQVSGVERTGGLEFRHCVVPGTPCVINLALSVGGSQEGVTWGTFGVWPKKRMNCSQGSKVCAGVRWLL